MTAGYSATPLLKKLGLKAGMRAWPVNVPADGVATDLDGNQVRAAGLAAVDEVGSGLKFVYRVADR